MDEKRSLKKFISECPSFVCFFLACILMFFLYLILPQKEFSDMENRYLELRPKLSLAGLKDGSFMKSFDTYTDEQLPFRDPLIGVKSGMETLMLKKENNGIVKGKDGYLFEKILKPDQRLSRNEAAIKKFVSENERDFYIGIIPNSFEILNDRVPKGLPEISEKEYTDKFYGELSVLENVHTIDMYGALEKAAAGAFEGDDEQLYYRTDHHWTTEGAYRGYLEICKEMGLEPVNREVLSDGRIEGFFGTYYAKYKGHGIESDEIIYYNIPVKSYTVNDGEKKDGLYDFGRTGTYDKYAFFLHGNYGFSEIISDPSMSVRKINEDAEPESSYDKRDTLIIFKDSYANCLIPFLTFDYDRIIVMDMRYYGGSVKELLSEEKDADILLLYNFSHLNEDNNFYKLVNRGQ
ncbi:MAG: hypothetical protein K5886_12380 [Lachnospiraceae bacterium]|nr:hypothetical protein [Lachnospiraceae bacterium]